MRKIYILCILIISILSSCNVETYLSKEFTIGRNENFVTSTAQIRLQGGKCWIDGVKIPDYEKTDTAVIFRCSGTEIIFKIQQYGK